MMTFFKPYFQDADVTLFHGDCLDVLRTLPDSSVDAVVTDPPYGLEFMGKDWDGADGFRRSLNPNDAGRDNAFGRTSKTSPEYRTTSKASAGMMPTGYTDGANRLERPSHLGGLNPKCRNCDHWQRGGNPCACDVPDFPNERLPRLHDFQVWCEAWSVECLRVLKPGGYMLAFGGTRTSHRLACAIEDAGFEIRDSIAWLYGSGFPKHRAALKPAFEPIVMARKPFGTSLIVNEAKYGTGALNIAACRVPSTAGQRPKLEAWVNEPSRCNSCAAPVVLTAKPPTLATRASTAISSAAPTSSARDESTQAATSKTATGCSDGTSPAAMSSNSSTDASGKTPTARSQRASSSTTSTTTPSITDSKTCDSCGAAIMSPTTHGSLSFTPTSEPRPTTSASTDAVSAGRWPSNVVLDGSQADALDAQSGILTSGLMKARTNREPRKGGTIYGADQRNIVSGDTYADSGGASRFFPTFRYEAKAPTLERPRAGDVAHPTVKPLDLMRWLVRLVTPPGGTVLEPFAGSGTTAEACILEGFKCIAIEREADYLPLIIQRISKPLQVGFDFGEVS